MLNVSTLSQALTALRTARERNGRGPDSRSGEGGRGRVERLEGPVARRLVVQPDGHAAQEAETLVRARRPAIRGDYCLVSYGSFISGRWKGEGTRNKR